MFGAPTSSQVGDGEAAPTYRIAGGWEKVGAVASVGAKRRQQSIASFHPSRHISISGLLHILPLTRGVSRLLRDSLFRMPVPPSGAGWKLLTPASVSILKTFGMSAQREIKKTGTMLIRRKVAKLRRGGEGNAHLRRHRPWVPDRTRQYRAGVSGT